MLCRLGQLIYDTLLLASNMINPKNVTYVQYMYMSTAYHILVPVYVHVYAIFRFYLIVYYEME